MLNTPGVARVHLLHRAGRKNERGPHLLLFSPPPGPARSLPAAPRQITTAGGLGYQDRCMFGPHLAPPPYRISRHFPCQKKIEIGENQPAQLHSGWVRSDVTHHCPPTLSHTFSSTSRGRDRIYSSHYSQDTRTGAGHQPPVSQWPVGLVTGFRSLHQWPAPCDARPALLVISSRPPPPLTNPPIHTLHHRRRLSANLPPPPPLDCAAVAAVPLKAKRSDHQTRHINTFLSV
ncbi:hypothetical protein E2C01_027000 [Portunus trituberculatus]|uniref:Uncharacterized protein n=1 Tax=Portunus trituberculatus TaxID=210409 RepID=A0A5B7EML6_PORTR|nr:hypothetical protein [Portunus trituberculatus]